MSKQNEYEKLLCKHLSKPIKIVGERAITLYLYKHGDININKEDFDLINKVLTTNHKPEEGRSIFVNLKNSYKSKFLPFKLDAAQIKGVKFDIRMQFKQYSGVGVCPLYYYADSSGKLNEIRNLTNTIIVDGSRVGKDAVGTMDYEEAIKEFFLSIHLLRNRLKNIYVKYPLAVGKFENIEYDNGYLGFEVLLTNKLFLERTKDYLTALNKNDENTAINIIKKRAQILHTLHKQKYLAPFLTLDNLQVFANKKWSLLHDMGDSRFLSSTFIRISKKAFLSESFWNLYYIMQHNRAILPGAQGYEMSINFLEKNKDKVFATNIIGYFGKKLGSYIAKKYKYEDFEDTLNNLINYGHKKSTSLFRDFVRFSPWY